MGWDVLLVDIEGFSLWGGSPFTAQMLLSYIRKLAKPKPVGDRKQYVSASSFCLNPAMTSLNDG